MNEYKILTPEELDNYIKELYDESVKERRSKLNSDVIFYTEQGYDFFNLLMKENYVFIINEMHLEDYERKNLLKLVHFNKFDLVDGLIQGIKEKQQRIKNKKWVEKQSTFIIPSNKWQMIKL